MQDERNLPDNNADLFVTPIDFRELNKQKNLANGVKVLSRTIYSVEARRKFSILLDRFSPDLIHLQNYLGHITLSILFEAKLRGLPVITTLHDYGMICPNAHFLIDRTKEICEACRGGHFYNAIRKRCKKDSILASGMATFLAYCNRCMGIMDKTDLFITPSNFLKNKLLENGFPSARLYHLPLFLPDNYFWASEQDKGYLLFLGKLETIKGIEVLIEAARQVNNVPIKIAGNVAEPLASRLPDILPKNAEYVGLKHGQELINLLRNALAIVLPSIWYENQPFSILEAFACGKPAIVSDLGGMTELVTHKERGLLVKPGNPAELARAMDWAVSNPAKMKDMGKNARQYALDNHSAELHYSLLSGLYSRLISRLTLS